MANSDLFLHHISLWCNFARQFPLSRRLKTIPSYREAMKPPPVSLCFAPVRVEISRPSEYSWRNWPLEKAHTDNDQYFFPSCRHPTTSKAAVPSWATWRAPHPLPTWWKDSGRCGWGWQNPNLRVPPEHNPPLCPALRHLTYQLLRREPSALPDWGISQQPVHTKDRDKKHPSALV